MLYQLPSGKVIEMSVEQYLDMSDDQLDRLIARNQGDILEDPWHGSILNKQIVSLADDEEIFPDLTDLNQIEKYTDLDIDYTITGLDD
jgi:hypothetical protein